MWGILGKNMSYMRDVVKVDKLIKIRKCRQSFLGQPPNLLAINKELACKDLRLWSALRLCLQTRCRFLFFSSVERKRFLDERLLRL